MAQFSPPKPKFKRMTPLEFLQDGFLMEVNRQILHPLGLALSINVCDHRDHEAGSCKLKYGEFGPIWDARSDPDGIFYAGPFTELESAHSAHIFDLYDAKIDNRADMGCDSDGVQQSEMPIDPTRGSGE